MDPGPSVKGQLALCGDERDVLMIAAAEAEGFVRGCVTCDGLRAWHDRFKWMSTSSGASDRTSLFVGALWVVACVLGGGEADSNSKRLRTGGRTVHRALCPCCAYSRLFCTPR